jgi:hypothetical protein
MANSGWFKQKLNVKDPPTRISLQDFDIYPCVPCWIKWLKGGGGRLQLDTDWGGYLGDYARMIDKLDLHGFENVVVDELQETAKFEEDDHFALDEFRYDGTDNNKIADYVLETCAFQIVTKGWQFLVSTERGENHRGLGTREGINGSLEIPTRLLLRVDELNEAKMNGKLIDPKARRDCKWHVHGLQEQKQCPRYQALRLLYPAGGID